MDRRVVPFERRPLTAGVHVPDPDRPVIAAGCQRLPIGCKGRREDPVRVPREHPALGAGRGVPQPCRMVPAGGRQRLAVGRNGDRGHSVLVSDQGRRHLAVGEVTTDHRPIPARQQPAIRREGERWHPGAGGVHIERGLFVTGCHVPELDRSLTPRRRHEATVRGECNRFDRPGVPVEGAQVRAGRNVPELHGPIAARRRQRLAIGRKRHARARCLVRLNRAGLSPGRNIPEP